MAIGAKIPLESQITHKILLTDSWHDTQDASKEKKRKLLTSNNYKQV